jgi:hypothetical protein
VKKFDGIPPEADVTIAYLICSKRRPDGPRVLAAWGMGGRETLIWCRALRTKCKALLDRALASTRGSMIIGEFKVPRKKRPSTLASMEPEAMETAFLESPW